MEAKNLTSDSDIVDTIDAIRYDVDMKKHIYYRGLKFTRDEKTNYYLNSSNSIRLHRYVYECEKGKIPDGYQVHHIDLDKSNNSIENLKLLNQSDHMSYHGLTLTEEQKEKRRLNLEIHARPKASEWHGSKEGRAWHSIHGRQVATNMKSIEYTCLNCGKTFFKKPLGTNKFCSNACKSSYRRKSGIDNVEETCLVCDKKFTHNKYSKQCTCSHGCANTYKKWKREGKISEGIK